MSIANLLEHRLSAESLARFLGFLLVAWQPFWSGARLPSVLLVLLGLWLLWHKRLDFSTQAAKRLGLVFALLGVPVLLSIPTSFEVAGSVNVALALLLFYLVGLVLLQALAREEDHLWLQNWLRVVLLAWAADGCIQYAFGRDLLGAPLSPDGRILGPFDNLHLGLFLTVLMPLILWRPAAERPWSALSFVVLIAFIAGMSGARSNVVFLFLAVATLLLRFGWRQRLIVMAGLALVLSASLFLSPTFQAKVKQLDAPAVGLREKIDHALSGRLTIWETAWRMLQDRPLTGVGANAFAEAYDHYSFRPDDPFRKPWSPYHAHQMYVAAAAETGWPGLMGLIAAVAFCTAWYLRTPVQARHEAAPYAASLAVIAFPIQSQPVLYSIWWFPVVLLLLCGMLSALERSKTEGK